MALPGCRSVGEVADRIYDGAVATFVPNPVAAWGFFAGYGVGFVAGAPFMLFSWPLTLLFYPDDEDAFKQQAILAPSLTVGALIGSIVAVPLYPFGWPFTPDEPEAWRDEPEPTPPPEANGGG